MTAPTRPLRADARRNREAILAAAGELFGEQGDEAQIEEVAARAGLGVGTVYRHFADKQALLAAIVGRRFEAATELARSVDELTDAGEAFERLLYGYLESVCADSAFRRALLGPEEPRWESIAAQKEAFREVVSRIVQRAVDAAVLRADFGVDDFVRVTRGAMANMPDDADWRRHVELQLEGIRP
ncbi:TetR/AcrR family transcriptional regulator [Humibacter albus]|jgi:AcrR family transcriptional regulator|uniref:TetR/AcrR family transcriptional regulator n=1 Tax=Humibacter albus TaxID=427754 RepID=UPI0003B64F95|nr:TetR/AcrR family transcriptional regulator [Humibacter albus]